MDEPSVTITETELRTILKNKLEKKAEVLDYKTQMLESDGLCGSHALLKVLTENNTELCFFLKLYPRTETIIRFIEQTGAFKKEIFVYNLFHLYQKEDIKLLDSCVPRCYLSVAKKFIILDNITEEGYSTTDKFKFFDYSTIRSVLEALSKLHASTLIYEEKKCCKLIDVYDKDLDDCYFNNSIDSPFRESIQAAMLGILNCIKLFNFPEKLPSGKDFRTVLAEVCRQVYQLARPSRTFRNVLTHGDIWATNLLIKFDDTHEPVNCKLVDFQCVRYTPPAQDVMAVLHLTTSREFRKKHMYSLIGIYYNFLEKYVSLSGFNMKKILPFQDFLASCEEQKVFGMVQAAIYFPLILLKSEDVNDCFANRAINKEALSVDRSLLVRKYMDSNKTYKERIKDSIQDLKDYCDYL